MTSYNIRVKTTNKVIRVKRTNKVKSTVQTGVALEGRFRDLLDVDVTSASDKYLIMYDANVQKYIAVNPDDVLISSVEEPNSPGLPDQFIDKLDIDLDNKIDLDGGTW